nr:MIP06251p [Drosophila melanogaster]
MGVGWAPKDRSKKGGRKILVVRYSPAGNQPGEYAENIGDTEFLEYFKMPTREDPDRWRNGSARLSYGVVDVQICISLLVLTITFIRKA